MYQVIQLHLDAPAKPEEGAPCNGCGVCCASEPCPVGVLVSRRRRGACKALLWAGAESELEVATEGSGTEGNGQATPLGRYRCGLIARPAAYLPHGLRAAAPLLARLARRFIAAGIGCDSSLRIERSTRR